MKITKVGILLSGCGVMDGSEIREAVLTILAVDRSMAKKGKGENDYKIEFMAPDHDQMQVVDHLAGKVVEGEKRNILKESARIARGKIRSLKEVKAQDLDLIILPGGYGAAKNLSSFATQGAKGVVDPEVKRILLEMHQSKKPIGAICIAPAILAILFGGEGVQITVGNDSSTIKELEKTGAKHVECQVDEICHDKNHRVVTTPAYMYDDAKLHKIEQGIQGLVDCLVSYS